MIDVTAGNAVYYYHFDGLGSVAALSNNSGEIVERYSYDVFGRADRVSDVNNPYFFTGRRYDNETGLYYYRARYYDPWTGRFLQPDPVAQFLQLASTQRPTTGKIPGTYLSAQAIEKFLQDDPIGKFLRVDPAGRFLKAGQFGFPVELNLYTYCGNNPIIFIDPYGLWWPSGIGLVGGFTMAAGAILGNPTLMVIGAALLVVDYVGQTLIDPPIDEIEEQVDRWDDEARDMLDGDDLYLDPKDCPPQQ